MQPLVRSVATQTARTFASPGRSLEIGNGNSVQVIDIDSKKPFAIVLPVNAGSIVFYDVDGNAVEFVEHIL